jgi:hypothetical protein
LPYLEGSENVEQTLEEFRGKADDDLECRRQLLAIQYYLKGVINLSQGQWMNHTRGVSNYKTLLDQVRGCERVCFVTFNYDTLMEAALQGIGVSTAKISDYIAHPKCSLIKAHGSTDWQFWIRKLDTGLEYNEQPTDQEMILAAPTVRNPVIAKGADAPREAKRERYFSLPALAIPTVSKQSFVCPKEHLDELVRLIPDVTKIAIVGWRAGEKHFLNLLKEGLTRTVPVIAACGTESARAETFERIAAAGISAHFINAPFGGFTDFVVNRQIESILHD